jgi:hypothetical protein
MEISAWRQPQKGPLQENQKEELAQENDIEGVVPKRIVARGSCFWEEIHRRRYFLFYC